MRNFTLRKGFLGSKCGTHSSFKGFIMLVVMMLMMASSAMAEVIDGLRYVLDPVKKTATLLPKKEGKYSDDIIIPEKVKGNDGVEYVVTSLSEFCFYKCSGLTSITIPSSVTSLGWSCFEGCSGLETVYFKGKEPENTSQSEIPTTTIIKVPTEYLQGYKDAFGYSYKYIYAWNPDGSGDDTKPVTPCSTPTISYESGKLMFACETTGAKYHYTITDTDIKSNALSENGEVSLSAAYNISVYATADGYKASDKAEATLYWVNANLDNGTNINQVRTRGVVASAHDGIISLSGLADGEVVKFFAADGKYLGSTVAANGAASYAVSESLIIAKVGKDSIKMAMKQIICIMPQNYVGLPA